MKFFRWFVKTFISAYGRIRFGLSQDDMAMLICAGHVIGFERIHTACEQSKMQFGSCAWPNVSKFLNDRQIAAVRAARALMWD